MRGKVFLRRVGLGRWKDPVGIQKGQEGFKGEEICGRAMDRKARQSRPDCWVDERGLRR